MSFTASPLDPPPSAPPIDPRRPPTPASSSPTPLPGVEPRDIGSRDLQPALPGDCPPAPLPALPNEDRSRSVPCHRRDPRAHHGGIPARIKAGSPHAYKVGSPHAYKAGSPHASRRDPRTHHGGIPARTQGGIPARIPGGIPARIQGGSPRHTLRLPNRLSGVQSFPAVPLPTSGENTWPSLLPLAPAWGEHARYDHVC